MTNTRRTSGAILAAVLLAAQANAQVSIDELAARGEVLYNSPAACAVCHKKDGTGLIGPDITYGPTPSVILDQLLNNPQMGGIAQELKADNEDLIALAVYQLSRVKRVGCAQNGFRCSYSSKHHLFDQFESWFKFQPGNLR